MQDVSLNAHAGRTTGSASSRRLRSEGKIPCVLYGHGIDPLSLAVDSKEFRTALNREGGINALISLDVDGTKHLAMARQLQRNPVKGTVDHVDFVIVRRDEVVAAEVPIRIEGEAEAVRREDGLVEQQLFSLVVHATPGNIPSHLEVDISALTIGETVRVGDLTLPAGATTDVDAEEPVVVAQASRLAEDLEAVEAEAAEAAAEAAEEEGAPEAAAEGEAEKGEAGAGGGESQGGAGGGGASEAEGS